MYDGPQNGFVNTPRNADSQGSAKTDAGLDGSDSAVQGVLQVEMPNGK
jgi:hypothetical protein